VPLAAVREKKEAPPLQLLSHFVDLKLPPAVRSPSLRWSAAAHLPRTGAHNSAARWRMAAASRVAGVTSSRCVFVYMASRGPELD